MLSPVRNLSKRSNNHNSNSNLANNPSGIVHTETSFEVIDELNFNMFIFIILDL